MSHFFSLIVIFQVEFLEEIFPRCYILGISICMHNSNTYFWLLLAIICELINKLCLQCTLLASWLSVTSYSLFWLIYLFIYSMTVYAEYFGQVYIFVKNLFKIYLIWFYFKMLYRHGWWLITINLMIEVWNKTCSI